MKNTRRNTRRILVGIVGGTLVVAGLFMLVFFGPGVLTLAAGLAILSTEFAWAVRWLSKMRQKISQVGQNQRIKARRKL